MEGSTHISTGDVHRHGDAFHTKSGHTLHALWTQKRSPSRQPQLVLAKSVCNHRAQQLRQATPTCWRLGYSLPHKTFDIVGHHVWIQPNSLRCPQFCAQLPLQFCFPCAAAARPPSPLLWLATAATQQNVAPLCLQNNKLHMNSGSHFSLFGPHAPVTTPGCPCLYIDG